MVSDKFLVNSDAGRIAAAQYATERFVADIGLKQHDALRLSLLVEETLGMVKVALDEFYGQMWFEGDDKACEIHFEATADMNAGKRRELLSVSRTGKNAASRGFMAMLGDVITNALYGFGRTMDAYGQETMRYGIVNDAGMMTPGGHDMTPIWTLQSYRTNLDRERENDLAAEAACEDLEKSIVGSLADDVVVGVDGDRIELVITRKF